MSQVVTAKSLVAMLLSIVCCTAFTQPTPLRPAHAENSTSACGASRAELVRSLTAVRGRAGGRSTWLANWFVPAPEDWTAARRAASDHMSRGCESFAVVNQAHNLRLALSPCFTQCADLFSSSDVAQMSLQLCFV